MAAGAQAPTAAASDRAGGDDPVAQVRKSQAFEIGPFVNGGTGLGNRNNYQFLSAGVQGGKILTPVIGHGLLAGQFEYGANIMPLWLGFTPPPNPAATFLYPDGTSFTGPEGGGTYVGAVSYTHLDVYKRQSPSWPSDRSGWCAPACP